MGSDEAFVTLATNDSYGLGALVLGHSLRKAGTSRSLAILITPGVTQTMRNLLSNVYDLVQLVDVLDSQDSANLALLARPELGITLTKLHAWNLTQFKKAVFLDADTLVLQNVDDLFEREELSAVPDVGWPDCFNTGVFVFRPSAQTYAALIEFTLKTGSFDGGDQGLLNSFFHDWATKDIKTHLPFIYNMVATVIYSYAPAFKQFGHNVKIVHFLGSTKPWHQARPTSASSSSVVLGNFLQLWWRIFDSNVRSTLEPGLAGLAGTLAQLDLGTNFAQPGEDIRKASHRHDWESGNIDYLGADSFDNIQRRIQESIGSGGASVKSPAGKAQSPPRVTAQASGQTSQEIFSQVQRSGVHVVQSTQPQQAPSSHQVHPTGSQAQQHGKQATPPPQSAKQSSPAPQGVTGQPKQAAAAVPHASKEPSPPVASTAQSGPAKPQASKEPSPPVASTVQSGPAKPQASKEPSPPVASTAQSGPAKPQASKEPSPPVASTAQSGPAKPQASKEPSPPVASTAQSGPAKPQASKEPSPPVASTAQSGPAKPQASKEPSPPLSTGQSKAPQGGQPPRPAQR